MYEPRPYGRHGADLTGEDAAAAELLMRRLTNLKEASGVDTLKLVRALPSGAIAIAQDAGGILKLIIQPVSHTESKSSSLSVGHIPMLFSGAIDNGIVRADSDAAITVKLSEMTRRRLNAYDPSKPLPPKTVPLQRFMIPHGDRFSELMPPPEVTEVKWTQYVNQRPTWYSGAMAEVMQVVGGYGRQEFNNLPDDSIERARFLLPGDVVKTITEELGRVRLPGYSGVPDMSGEFQCDYKFNSTNGVGFDIDQNPWLLRVNQSGVYAMPLPVIPATTTDAFRAYTEDVGDGEILWLLDRFGGMPTGESFPTSSQDFESWRRAGVVIKICDAGGFYNHIMYSTACGWTFSSNGSEGFNTCYDYDDDEGLAYGLAFKLKLKLGVAENRGMVKMQEGLESLDPGQTKAINAYLSSLFQLLGDTTVKSQAIKYKLRRTEAEEILARVTNEVDQNEIDYWDNQELDPIAIHTGKISEVGRGWLHNPAKFLFQPQIKFAEPLQGGCISFNFSPLLEGRNKNPLCDTIMFGYYIGDDLKVVKYFRDSRGFVKEVESDFDECMSVGSWTQTATTGSTALAGSFYTTDFDERKELAPIVETTHIVGRDLGFDSKPFFSFDFFFSTTGTMWRNRYYSHKTTVKRSTGRGLDVAVCIPYLTRNAIYHASKEYTSGGTTTESISLGSVQDPYSYRYWTYDFVFAWVGSLEVQKGRPYPKNGNPVWVEIENYSPNNCSDFADQGSWVSGLPADYTWLIHPKTKEWHQSGGGGPPSVNAHSVTTQDPSSQSGKLSVSILDTAGEINKNPANDFFLPSPNEFGWIFYSDAIRVTAGEAEYANTLENEPNPPTRRKKFGSSSLATSQTAHHFIGVINE